MKFDMNDILNKVFWGFFAGCGYMLAQYVVGLIPALR